MKISLRILFCSIAISSSLASAAPLDALLSADEYHIANEFHAEVGLDAMNDMLDVFKMRDSSPLYTGSKVGDYSGLHLRLGYALTNRLSLDSSLWQRNITYRNDIEKLYSWQFAGQYSLYGDENSTSHFALRLSAWGDQSGPLTKSTPTTFGGRTVSSLSINSPVDSQRQIDAIGTWRLSETTSLSAFASSGSSEVSIDGVSAKYTSSNGCNYILAFTSRETSGHLATPCNASGAVLTAFSTSESVLNGFSYKAHYYQLGGMLKWQTQNWTLKGGYQYQRLQRANVDELIASVGGGVYQLNHIVVAEVKRKVSKHADVFVRGQAMSNQFVGEIPFVYNRVTASKFSSRYGFATLGVMVKF